MTSCLSVLFFGVPGFVLSCDTVGRPLQQAASGKAEVAFLSEAP